MNGVRESNLRNAIDGRKPWISIRYGRSAEDGRDGTQNPDAVTDFGGAEGGCGGGVGGWGSTSVRKGTRGTRRRGRATIDRACVEDCELARIRGIADRRQISGGSELGETLTPEAVVGVGIPGQVQTLAKSWCEGLRYSFWAHVKPGTGALVQPGGPNRGAKTGGGNCEGRGRDETRSLFRWVGGRFANAWESISTERVRGLAGRSSLCRTGR